MRKVFSSYSDYDLIDAIQERAFSEGYMQRMFDEDAEDNKAGKVLTGIGAGAFIGGAGMGGYTALKDKKALEGVQDAVDSIKRAGINLKKNTIDNLKSGNLNEAWAGIKDSSKSVVKDIRDIDYNRLDKIAGSVNKKKLIERLKDAGLKGLADGTSQEIFEKEVKKAVGRRSLRNAALLGAPGAALIGTGLYVNSKSKKKNK